MKRLSVGFSLVFFVILISCTKDYRDLEIDVLSHAGESLYPIRNKFPPNSLKGIKYSLTEANTEGVEIDIQMTSDAILVLFHDQMMDENSDNSGCINSKMYSEIQATKIYKSDEVIPTLKEVFDFVIPLNKRIVLDVKHWNACSESAFNYQIFNYELANLLVSYTTEQRTLISVNSGNLTLLDAVSITGVNKSYETDDIEAGILAIQNNGIDQLIIKLEAMNAASNGLLKNNNVEYGIFNLKTKKEVKSALDFAPSFVISDKIEYTLKLING